MLFFAGGKTMLENLGYNVEKILFCRPFFGGVRARNLPQKSCNIMGFMVEWWS